MWRAVLNQKLLHLELGTLLEVPFKKISTFNSMASSKRWANLICSIAFLIYFFIIIFQVPIFRIGICKTPLEVTSSQLITSEVFPVFIVKALLYPGAIAKAITHRKPIPSFGNSLKWHKLNLRPVSAASDLQRLEVIAGSYLSVGGAIMGLIKPNRMSLLGMLLLMWGLIREVIMGRSGLGHAKGVHIYPAMYIAVASAFFSIKKDVREIVRSFAGEEVVKVKSH